jgi:hypothetical protein
MLFDRLVGAFSLVVTLVCIATITGILSGNFSTYVFQLKIACFLASLIPVFYLQGHVARRDGLPHDEEGVDIWPILSAVPRWAAVTNLLLMSILFLCGGLYWWLFFGGLNVGVCVADELQTISWAQEPCVVRISETDLFDLFFVALSLNLSFISASYLLFRRLPPAPLE